MNDRFKDAPLHVKVIVALRGNDHYVKVGPDDPEPLPEWRDPAGPKRKPKPDDYFFEAINDFVWVPRYDTDWSATGPLIEQFGIGIDLRGAGWCASAVMDGVFHRADPAFADTPLIAVCNLILALKASGQLDKEA